jgi:hypothetical protein
VASPEVQFTARQWDAKWQSWCDSELLSPKRNAKKAAVCEPCARPQSHTPRTHKCDGFGCPIDVPHDFICAGDCVEGEISTCPAAFAAMKAESEARKLEMAGAAVA